MQLQSISTSGFAKIPALRRRNAYFSTELTIRRRISAALLSLTEVFGLTSTCIKTLKDDLATAFDKTEVRNNIELFRNVRTSKENIKLRFGVEDVVQWKVEPARRAIRDVRLEDFITQYQARPFDYRWMFYHGAVVGSPRTEVMRNLLKTSNRALIANRKIRTGDCYHFWVTTKICVSEIISSADNSNCFPLYVLAEENELQLEKDFRPNFSTNFLKQLCSVLGVKQVQKNGVPVGLTPEDIFHYAYAVFYSPGYRSRYAEYLKIDFPRLPLTGNLDLFRALARLGRELTTLHLLESPKLAQTVIEFSGGRNPEVEKVGWSQRWRHRLARRGGHPRRDSAWHHRLPRRIRGKSGASTSAATKSARSGSRTARAAPYRRKRSRTTRRLSSLWPRLFA